MCRKYSSLEIALTCGNHRAAAAAIGSAAAVNNKEGFAA
jgi:hypothetical protein